MGTGVTEVNYSGQSSQQWYFVSVGNGLYRILNAASDYAIQTDNGNPANVTLAASVVRIWRNFGAFLTKHIGPKKGTAGYEGPPYQRMSDSLGVQLQ